MIVSGFIQDFLFGVGKQAHRGGGGGGLKGVCMIQGLKTTTRSSIAQTYCLQMPSCGEFINGYSRTSVSEQHTTKLNPFSSAHHNPSPSYLDDHISVYNESCVLTLPGDRRLVLLPHCRGRYLDLLHRAQSHTECMFAIEYFNGRYMHICLSMSIVTHI